MDEEAAGKIRDGVGPQGLAMGFAEQPSGQGNAAERDGFQDGVHPGIGRIVENRRNKAHFVGGFYRNPGPWHGVGGKIRWDDVRGCPFIERRLSDAGLAPLAPSVAGAGAQKNEDQLLKVITLQSRPSKGGAFSGLAGMKQIRLAENNGSINDIADPNQAAIHMQEDRPEDSLGEISVNARH